LFSEVPQIQAGASPWTPLLNFRPRPPDSLENFGSNQWSPLKAQPQTIVAVAECPIPLNFRLEPPKTGVPNLGCRHPLGCQTQIQGCQTRFRGVMQNSKFGAPHRLSQIWILINYDGRVSNQLGLTDGYCARTRLGILGLKRYVVVWFCLLLLELPCARIKLNKPRKSRFCHQTIRNNDSTLCQATEGHKTCRTSHPWNMMYLKYAFHTDSIIFEYLQP